jgi:hypothetical protein
MSVELSRSSNYAPGSPPSLKVNIVTVTERDCPGGEEPIAVRLLALRDAARTEPEQPCSALTPTQLQLLRTCGRKTLSATPTNCEVYSALAALGGHLRSNGEPGWIVLGRAYEKLLVLEQGWLAAQGAGDPIDD